MFTSDRLLYRALQDSDIDHWYEVWNDFRIQRFNTEGPVVPRPPKFKDELKAKVESWTIWFTLVLKDTGEFVGQVCMRLYEPKNRDGVYGITLHPKFWGNGYGMEASKFMIAYSFETLGLQRVSLEVFGDNTRAIALYKKLGFKHEGTKRRAIWVEGHWDDKLYMGVLEEEWAALHNKSQGCKREHAADQPLSSQPSSSPTMEATLADLQSEVIRLRHELQSLAGGGKDDDQVTISDYLLTRLEQLGVTSIFGVPGDFNMPFLDYIEDHPRIQWIGNCNELNAAYAADGYARVKPHSIGVVITTFGVGELSAINGVAGALSEMVPVLHIVGAPSTIQLKTRPLLHHTLGDGRFDVYTKAAEQVTISQAMLMNKVHAAAEIDRVLCDCITRARPVYLSLPTDMVGEKVSAKRLKAPLSRAPPPNSPDVESFVLDEITKAIDEADSNIIILVDACVIRHDVQDEVKDLVTATRFPVYSTPMGKTAVSEEYDRYGGIYIGSISDPVIKENVEKAKLILFIGALKSDFNTGMFTYRIPTTHVIELHSDHTLVRHAHFPGIGMKLLLPKLTSRLKQHRVRASELIVPRPKLEIPVERGNNITQAYFWPRVSKFFKKKDVIIAETGTSNFGLIDVPLPEQSLFLSQILYGSIGWTVGSTLGAAIAARDRELGRVILFIGDGSMQLGVQELSTMVHHRLTPIIFLINNDGYNIERSLHGPNRKYNDIAGWKWTSLLTTLGDVNGTMSKSYTVTDKPGLEKLLDDPEFASAGKIQLVEVIMGKYDTPRALKLASELSSKYAEKSAKQL